MATCAMTQIAPSAFQTRLAASTWSASWSCRKTAICKTVGHATSKGFAILIRAPGAKRRFVPLEGETITITDKDGKEIWSLKIPAPIDNPGVIICEVQIDLLTEREFTHFWQKTWTRPDQPPPSVNG
jgi:hypothetical protein